MTSISQLLEMDTPGVLDAHVLCLKRVFFLGLSQVHCTMANSVQSASLNLMQAMSEPAATPRVSSKGHAPQ